MHIWLVLANMSTVEQLAMRSMKERERAVLNTQFGWTQFKCAIVFLLPSVKNALLIRHLLEQGETRTSERVGRRMGKIREGGPFVVYRELEVSLGAGVRTESVDLAAYVSSLPLCFASTRADDNDG